MAKKKFSVLLLRPDYMASPFGQDTYLAHVRAHDVAEAIASAQAEAIGVDFGEDDDYPPDPDDYHVLLCAYGHIYDLTVRD